MTQITVNNKVYGLEFNIRASRRLAKLCPNGDLTRIGEIFDDVAYNQALDIVITAAVAMSEGYEGKQAFLNKDYTPHPLTEEDFDFLDPGEIQDTYQTPVMDEMYRGMHVNIEIEPTKENKKSKKKTTSA